RREEDPEPTDDPYCYTTFIDLHDIFKEQWTHLCTWLPDPIQTNRKDFLLSLQKLNGIRNRIMHPVRGQRPTREDFKFVSNFVQTLAGTVQSQEQSVPRKQDQSVPVIKLR